jgi:hypothetical protein
MFLTGNIGALLLFVLFISTLITTTVFVLVNYFVKNKIHFLWKVLFFIIFEILIFILIINKIDIFMNFFF